MPTHANIAIAARPGVKPLLAGAVVATLVLGWFFARWHFANAVAPTFDKTHPQSREVADWLADIAPADPTVRRATATVFERTFQAEDIARALSEYEAASAASPHDYSLWLNVARLRGLSGDTAGAETAFRRALELAPNYAAVQWAFGNFLVRTDRADEGFSLMARAAAADPANARAAAAIALQYFDGDTAAVLAVLGTNDAIRSALTRVLADARRPEEAVAVWNTMSPEARGSAFREQGTKLATDLAEAGRYKLAAEMLRSFDASGYPRTGEMTNGGFESGIRLRDAGTFEWKVGEGGSPQIGLGEDRPHSGRYHLVVVFDSFATAAFRPVTQLIAADSGTRYEVSGFYRSNVKTSSKLLWEAVEPSTSEVVGRSEPLAAVPDWTPFAVVFNVPAGRDGVLLRFNRTDCIGTTCPTHGTISFDDLAIKKL